jgi:hypothetical protein
MQWIELIHLRSFTQRDKDEAVAAFHQLVPPTAGRPLAGITLLRNADVDTDLIISIHWLANVSEKSKSPLGLQLAEAFSEFGLIHHTVWSNDADLIGETGAERMELNKNRSKERSLSPPA